MTAHKARKRFGQNFLHDPAIIRNIISMIQVRRGDNLIEIGPGLGALTGPLLEKLETMKAIELDRDLVKHLLHEFADKGELDITSADALKVDFGTFGDDLRVVGNLPYNISSPLLFHLLKYRTHIKDMHFMLQKEVVDRMAAPPGSKVFGRLSVMMQAYNEVCSLLKVAPGAFNPPPKVDSAIVRLIPRKKLDTPIDNAKGFEQLVAKAFSQRRKTLRNNLKGLLTDTDIEQLGIDPGCRAETLSVQSFIQLANRHNAEQ